MIQQEKKERERRFLEEKERKERLEKELADMPQAQREALENVNDPTRKPVTRKKSILKTESQKFVNKIHN